MVSICRGGFACKGGFETRPYLVVRQNYYPMHVIRHNYKFIKNDLSVMIWQIIPAFVHDLAVIIHPCLSF